jgi:hypothetical protein
MTTRTFARGPLQAAWRTVAILLAVGSLIVAGSRPQSAMASVVKPAFPRLAIWWPDTVKQPISLLARCDWIALQNRDADRIAQLRQANPSIIILGSTAARELNYVLGDYDNALNAELRSASTDWMLTQLGSTLASDVDASTTTIPVADATRFVVGDMVLVDHELMHVERVGTSSLTVTARGPVNPPATHAAGARIAAVVSHWADSIVMDLSSDCPVRDVGHGPETWGEWEARRAKSVLDGADWDGLLIDGWEGNLSWMATRGTNRSIDLLRTNIPVTDGYAAFNLSWNSGAVAFGRGLRNACGSKVLIGNGNLRDYGMNGTVFEEFPYDTLPPSWWDYIFVGPYGYPRASYPEWIANAQSPNLTSVQTYGESRDYRTMRFGLCSALLNDGYYSYALSASGHAVNGVWWYDEYDNAGAGRGYLGQPTGAAVKAGAAWRRDFTGGVSLVNPTASPVTVKLGGTFRKIKGTQAPTVNSGATVNSVTIPSRDGIILLRIPSVSLKASATTVLYGVSTTISVSVAPASAGTVRLERRTAGTSTWVASGAPSLDASGSGSVKSAPGVSTEYRAILVGRGVVSSTVKVNVRPLLAIRASRATVSRWSRVTFSGSITHPGKVPLLLQRRVGRSWKTVRRLVTSRTGRYSTAVSFASRGSFTYRVYAVADASHLAAASGAVSVRVR